MVKKIFIPFIFALLCTGLVCGCASKADNTDGNISVAEGSTENIPKIVIYDKEDTDEKNFAATAPAAEDPLLKDSETQTDATESANKESENKESENKESESKESENKESESKDSDNNKSDTTQVDSAFYITEITDDIKQRITGISYPGGDMQISYDDLRYLHLLYRDYSDNTQMGELICNKKIAEDLLTIFQKLYEADYQFDRIRLIDEYGGDDDASCADDNTSCFNYRVVTGGSKLSNHAYGLAIDINPYYNPYVKFINGTPSVLLPQTAAFIDRSADFPHKIDKDDLCYKLFTQYGFKWGGDYKTVKDYQHFERE